jgi:hypothetical protein
VAAAATGSPVPSLGLLGGVLLAEVDADDCAQTFDAAEEFFWAAASAALEADCDVTVVDLGCVVADAEVGEVPADAVSYLMMLRSAPWWSG